MNTLADRYAAMLETDLYREAEGVQNLVPAAREALRSEFERRHLSVKKFNWNAKASAPRPRRKTTLVGDAAGEYLDMERGDYSAWIHVVISVLLSVIFLTIAEVRLMDQFPRLKLAHTILNGLPVAITLWNYWNRWRCIEAFSSRFCAGVFNLSFFYVPLIAAFYAAYRGILKFFHH